MADTVTITLGIPGHNDRILNDLRKAALDLGLPLESAHAIILALGIAAAQNNGWIGERANKALTKQEILAALGGLYEDAPE